MPELPEVETVRRGLDRVLRGKRILSVEQRRPNLRFPLPQQFAERLSGTRIVSVTRRAKYILVHLSTAEVLLMHLGMSGRFLINTKRNQRPSLLGDYDYEAGNNPKHDHVVIRAEGGTTVTYNDPRRFGYMLVVPEADLFAHPLIRHLGVEPLGNELSAPHLAEQAAGRKADIKAFLMDQRIIAGLGNIYVCEALHKAGISPKRPASALANRSGKPTKRAERLVPEIRSVLAEALAAGGTTLRDYLQADGSPGAYQYAHRVYNREGLSCLNKDCGGTIRRITQSGRSTFYCPKCQT